MTLLAAVEFLLSTALTCVFWRKGLHRRFPVMFAYLMVRVCSTPLEALLLLIHSGAFPSLNSFHTASGQAYFFTYWVVYSASAVMLYFISFEIFRSALAAVPGLLRFGVVIFRWTVAVSIIVTFSTMTFEHRGIRILPDIGLGLMHSVSLLELCLLAFLCFSMNALKLSVRDLAFGLSLGFGIMAANDFVLTSLTSRFISLTTPIQYIYEVVILGCLGTWVGYCLMREPLRQPIVIPVNSTIYRWNEIGSALGHAGTQVAVPQPANRFFLNDVENLVEMVIRRNLKKQADGASVNSAKEP
jgi:hypothetical protein